MWTTPAMVSSTAFEEPQAMPPPPARASDETLTLTMTPLPEAPTAPRIPEERGDLVLAALLPRARATF